MVGVAGKVIQVTITKDGNAFDSFTVTTGTNGTVTFDYLLSQGGSYVARADFAQDTQYLASTNYTNFVYGADVVPSAPTASIGSVSAGQIKINWTTPTSDGGSAITGYKVYESGVLHATLGLVNTWTDTGLPENSTFYYKVAATNAIGQGALSNEVYATTPIVLDPTALAITSQVVYSTTQPDKVTITITLTATPMG